MHGTPWTLRNDMAPVVVHCVPCTMTGKQNFGVSEIRETRPSGSVAKVEGYAIAHAVSHILERLLAADKISEVIEELLV